MERPNLEMFFVAPINCDHNVIRTQVIENDDFLLKHAMGEPLVRSAIQGESYPKPYSSTQVVVSLFAIIDPGKGPIIGHLRMFYPHLPGPLEGTMVDLPKEAGELDEDASANIQELIRHADREINRTVANHRFSAN